MACYSADELRSLGLRFGENVRIDRSVMLFAAERITVGSNVRIDAYAVITAGEPVRIGDFVHLAAGAMIFGRGGVTMEDFSGLAPRVCILTASDDFVDGHLTNPTVPEAYTSVRVAPVVLKRHALVGCGSVVLPGVTLGEGAAVGALTLVRRDVPPFAVVAGNPCRTIAARNETRLRELEAKLLQQLQRP